ncbi:hypothetical protein NHN26_10950 [Rhodovulum tesquicola]|uniref:hypothetical protein n=1 Tax=Rhodovulum tesquicola TaxID=540254 RepID=UPI0020978154|nr:hypothetical protein [Rhodovulum tesquicola]MCO8145745.1 hypothetical protein [Rhodovulum tesquicola]
MEEVEKIQAEVRQANIEVIREIGFFAYRTLITLNSGAFIVILTFVANAKENSEFELDSFWLKSAMWAFLAGITLTFLSATVAYLQAQLNLLNKSLPLGSGAAGHLVWLLTPVILAFLAFVIGGVFAISGITAK